MQECLGININDKFIRYAKIEKNKTFVKVNAKGVRFYTNLRETINRIIDETGSRDIPISINIDKEKYYYFNIFNMTNKNYIMKAIDTEFGSFCKENKLNKDTYIGKYTYVSSLERSDQNRVMYIYENKTDLDERLSYFDKLKIETATVMPTSIPNLIQFEKNKNILIIDLDVQTKITTIIDQAIYNVEVIEHGLGEALDKINAKENSITKAYDMLKNITLYTEEMTMSNSNQINQEYLQDVVPVFYKIVQELQPIIDRYERIDGIYLSGLGSLVNNVDLYFKDFIKEKRIEILKPYFVNTQSNENIKDIIEVNSAIALALQGTGIGIKLLNFATTDWRASLKELANMKPGDLKNFNIRLPKPNIDLSLKGAIDNVEKNIFMDFILIIILIVAYVMASTWISNEILKKTNQAQASVNYTTEQKSLLDKDVEKLKNKKEDYNKKYTALENSSDLLTTKSLRKHQIPNLMIQIASIIPKQVRLTEIKTTEKEDTDATGKKITKQHVIIHAQSKRYEQLAYFKAMMIEKGYLDNIQSTEGSKDSTGQNIAIVIEGDFKTY